MREKHEKWGENGPKRGGIVRGPMSEVGGPKKLICVYLREFAVNFRLSGGWRARKRRKMARNGLGRAGNGDFNRKWTQKDANGGGNGLRGAGRLSSRACRGIWAFPEAEVCARGRDVSTALDMTGLGTLGSRRALSVSIRVHPWLDVMGRERSISNVE